MYMHIRLSIHLWKGILVASTFVIQLYNMTLYMHSQIIYCLTDYHRIEPIENVKQSYFSLYFSFLSSFFLRGIQRLKNLPVSMHLTLSHFKIVLLEVSYK